MLDIKAGYKRGCRRGEDDERYDFILHANGDLNREIRLAFLPFTLQDAPDQRRCREPAYALPMEVRPVTADAREERSGRRRRASAGQAMDVALREAIGEGRGSVWQGGAQET